MLVLSRKTGERILIGDQIALTIVRIGPNTVRLGIDAPRDLNIVREELCLRDDAIAVLDSASDVALPVGCTR
jgi:carbon storage regulator